MDVNVAFLRLSQYFGPNETIEFNEHYKENGWKISGKLIITYSDTIKIFTLSAYSANSKCKIPLYADSVENTMEFIQKTMDFLELIGDD